MGLDANGVKFLLYAKRRGVNFARTATIGRQSVLASEVSIERSFKSAGTDMIASEISEILKGTDDYCEKLLSRLGADSVKSFDASEYEGASIIHDFNFPIADEFKSAFTTVLDGGTLEHVFNYPVALKNCMEMVEVGGHFLAITPTNNFLGHGFYQFSPELFFNVFGGGNGFEIVDVIFFEDYENAPWFRVSDPRKAGGRITLENARPAYLLVIAKRTSLLPIFAKFPQQSDYAAAWLDDESSSNGILPRATDLGRIPRALLRRVKRLSNNSSMRFEPTHFTRFEPFE